eukprot:1158775-Pelagomonas_calceolata.AAC.4
MLQSAKSKQSSSHVPAGMTYAEVFSAAINAAMRSFSARCHAAFFCHALRIMVQIEVVCLCPCWQVWVSKRGKSKNFISIRRHKRAMVGNLSRKSDDSPAEMTFEEIQAYERECDL